MSIYDEHSGRSLLDQARSQSQNSSVAEEDAGRFFLVSEFYSAADAGLQAFRILSHDPETSQCDIVNVETGLRQLVDREDLIAVDD